MASNTNSIPIFHQLLDNIDKKGMDQLDQLISEGKENDFLEALKGRKFTTDEEATMSLFQKKKTPAYNKIKASIRAKIVHQIIGSTVHPSTLYSKIYSRVNTEYAAFNILAKRGQVQSAKYLGELILATCLKYELGDFLVPISSFFYEYYSIQKPNRRKVLYFKKIHEIHTLATSLEQKAKLAYADLLNLFVLELDPGKKAFIIAENHLLKLEPYLTKVPSIHFHIYTYLIIVFKHLALKEWKATNNSAMEAYGHFTSLPLRQPLIENIFLRKSVEANIELGEFEYCSQQLKLILTNSRAGQLNWFNTLDILVILNLHQERYKEAITAFITAKNHSNFEGLLPMTASRWGLLEAYINFLQLAGATPESPTMSRYRINKFINDTPQYAEDKKGRNIQLIIAQLLFYIIDKNWDKMEEKIEALQRYGTRYLRKGDLFRSQVFIKMLLVIPKRRYHPEAILRHTAKYQKRLAEMKPDINLNGSTLEIIPYEHLWELIIQNIVPPKYARKSTNTTINKKG